MSTDNRKDDSAVGLYLDLLKKTLTKAPSMIFAGSGTSRRP
jgi:hypothetical protein